MYGQDGNWSLSQVSNLTLVYTEVEGEELKMEKPTRSPHFWSVNCQEPAVVWKEWE